MAKKWAPVWRVGFLRALARTGNVRASAASAGVAHDKVYALRNGDEGFKKAWAKALACGRARAASGGGAARTGRLKALPGAEMCVRVSKNAGTQLVRVGAGKWTREAERTFFAELARTANVRAAARAAGFSTAAIYGRRMRDADFGEKWAGALAQASMDVDMALARGAKVALGDVDIDDGEEVGATTEPGAAPDAGARLTAREAIEVAKMLRPRDAAGAGAGGLRQRGTRARRPVRMEDVRDKVLRRLEAIRRHRARQAEAEGSGDGSGGGTGGGGTGGGGAGGEGAGA